MSRKRIQLTPHIRSKVVQAIQSGGYPHVAAEAMSVPKNVFADWVKRGDEPNAREPYRSFAGDVRVAFSQARLIAEIAVFKDEPKNWLIHGPGREMPESAGWSVSVKAFEKTHEQRNALLDPELMQLFRLLLQSLAPYPEARSQVSRTLVNFGVNEKAA